MKLTCPRPKCGKSWSPKKGKIPKKCPFCQNPFDFGKMRAKEAIEGRPLTPDPRPVGLPAEPMTLTQQEAPLPAGLPPEEEKVNLDSGGLPPMPGAPGMPSAPGAPGAMSPDLLAEQMEKTGRDFGKITFGLLRRLTKDTTPVDKAEEEGYCAAFGRIAVRHPEMFKAWMLDLMDAVIIGGVIFAKVTDKLERDKKEKEMKRLTEIGATR